MEIKMTVEKAETNLQRQFDWLERHDMRVVFIAGIDIAMLGFIASLDWNAIKADPYSQWTFIITLILLFLSLLFIYFSQYPKTKSTHSSLLFFGTITDLKFEEFAKRFKNLGEDDYLNDLLHQTYVNAKIVKKKFKYLKCALILLLVAVIPWVITIYIVNQAPIHLPL